MKIKLLAVVFFILACGAGAGSPERKLNLYPTPTPEVTQTPVFVHITTTPADTATARVVTSTPESTDRIELCIIAQEAVHLRPSASTDNYPIVALKNMDKVIDLGGRDGKWWFVQVGDKQGWIHSDYIGGCE